MGHQPKQIYEFGHYRLDAAERLLMRDGEVVPLQPKVFDLLLAMVERHGRLLEKDELMRVVWPDAIVEEANLANNISILRKTLSENGERFIETVPKRGYRFVAVVKEVAVNGAEPEEIKQSEPDEISKEPGAPFGGRGFINRIRGHKLGIGVMLAALIIGIITLLYLRSLNRQQSQPPLALIRLTFDAGVQSEPTWSPDGRWIAYSSNRSGNFEIWIQLLGGGNPRPITDDPATDWQPDWSPDGRQIVFRSERGGGGLFVVPALGGVSRKISSFGYRPRWSPGGAQILFYGSMLRSMIESHRMYVVALDGSQPREVLTEFMDSQHSPALRGVAWRPDSQHVSLLWIDIDRENEWNFWTAPLDGGKAIRSEITPEVKSELKKAELTFDRWPRVGFDNCLWAPSGQAVYFGAFSQGVRNLWKVTVDPRTLDWIAGPERLTTSPGLDSEIALSIDGKKLAYATHTENTRLWLLPFDAATGRLKGEGRPVTEDGTNAFFPSLSPDGKKLTYIASQNERRELREKSLEDGRETLLFGADGIFRMSVSWSRDGTRLAYRRGFRSTVILPANGGDEQVLTSPGAQVSPADWSADGKWILGTVSRGTPPRFQICLVPVAAAPHAETQLREIASDRDYNLYPHGFSPDDRWVAFNAIRFAKPNSRFQGNLSTIYIVPTSGGKWIRLAEGQYWDDKPRWSHDGQTIYFISDRTGFFNVWGIRFDPVIGKPVGAPFQVTTFDGPSKMILPFPGPMGFMLARDRLVLSIKEVSGSIWALENMDR
jgi:Tol biopolymer transport system component/DNA-binding winged helix-turn-helix (wHTH) protein